MSQKLIILIFIISHWLLIWMKAFGGKPKLQEGKTKPHLTGSALSLPWKKSLWGFACLSTKGWLLLLQPPLPRPPQAACVYNQLLQATLYLLASRIFCVYICTLLLFITMDLNQDASRKEDEISIFIHQGIQKCSLGENAIIFDEIGEGQEPSSINYCRYDFLIESAGKAACSFCFYSVNSR